MSESETRSVAAIGNSRVIPAKAGIQFTMCAKAQQQLSPNPRKGDDQRVIPAKAGIQFTMCANAQQQLSPGLRRGDDRSVIPAKAGISWLLGTNGDNGFALLRERRTRH